MRLKIELLNASVDLAVRDFQPDSFVIQSVGFLVALSGVGLLHKVGRLLHIVLFLRLKLLELLINGLQVLGFFVVSLIAVAAVATSLAEQIFAIANLPAHVAADQHHVGCVAGLASGFDVFLREERPQPVLIIAVGFLNTRGGAAIPLVARRASELFRIVGLEEFGLGMANKSLSVVIGLFLVLRCH